LWWGLAAYCFVVCGRAVCWLLFGQLVGSSWLLIQLSGLYCLGFIRGEVVKYYNILKNIIIKLIAQILTAKGQKTINATMLQRYFLFIFSPQILINIEL
jgi:hypothetical protein